MVVALVFLQWASICCFWCFFSPQSHISMFIGLSGDESSPVGADAGPTVTHWVWPSLETYIKLILMVLGTQTFLILTWHWSNLQLKFTITDRRYSLHLSFSHLRNWGLTLCDQVDDCKGVARTQVFFQPHQADPPFLYRMGFLGMGTGRNIAVVDE